MTDKKKTTITAEPGKQEIFITREFDAPRELVYRAFTDPELIPRWLGPRELTLKIDRYEAKEGGYWRFVHSDPDGNEFGFHGVTHELSSPNRIIRTFEFEGLPETGHVVLEIAEFEALADGRTKLTTQSVFRSVADRDGMIQSGMERGVNDSHQRLDDLLTELTGQQAAGA